MNETRKIPKTGIIIGAVALLVVIIVVSVLLALYFNSKVLEIVSLDILEQTKAGIMYYEETDDGANFTVKNNQARFNFDGLIKSGFSGYAVYSDPECTQEVEHNPRLSTGNNTFYIKAKTIGDSTVYVFNIRREYGTSVLKFYDYNGLVAMKATVEGAQKLELKEDGEIRIGKAKYTPYFSFGNARFRGWNVEDGIEVTQDMEIYANWEIDDSVFEYTHISSGYAITATDNEYWYLVIPSEHDGEPVTKICAESLGNNPYSRQFNKVYIPASITEIEPLAFRNISDLAQIVLDKNNAYYETNEEGTALIEKNTKTLIAVAEGLEKIPDGVVGIASYAFFNRSINVDEFVVPEGVVFIDERAFGSVQLKNKIVLPGTLRYLQRAAFAQATVTEVVFKEGITVLPEYTFFIASNLKKVTLPSTLEEIGTYAFDQCDGIYSITIPEHVTTIANNAFYGCTSLVEIVNLSSLELEKLSDTYGGVAKNAMEIFDSVDHPEYFYIDEDCIIYTKLGGKILLKVLGNGSSHQREKRTFPKDVTSIYNSAFSNASLIQTITIPKTVTSIGEYAFYGCIQTNLTMFYEGTMAEWASIEKLDHYYPNNTTITGIQCSDGFVTFESV